LQQSFASLDKDLDFNEYEDWKIFDQRLKALIREGKIRRVPASRTVYGVDEEWYLNEVSGELYLYLPPDERVRARWEPVDVFAPSRKEEVHPSGLAAIPSRQMNSVQRESLKQMLTFLVAQRVAVVVDRPKTAFTEGTETWYRDEQSRTVYRLIEMSDGNGRWELAPPPAKETVVQ
jgi:hypothetical protein